MFTSHLEGYSYNITGFVIAYKKVIEGDVENWQRHATLENASQTDVHYLSSYVLYTFRVTAMTYSGLGIPSDYVDAYTKQGGKNLFGENR